MEPRERMRRMREISAVPKSLSLGGTNLLDAAQLRKRQKVMLMGSQESGSTLIKSRFKRAKVG